LEIGCERGISVAGDGEARRHRLALIDEVRRGGVGEGVGARLRSGGRDRDDEETEPARERASWRSRGADREIRDEQRRGAHVHEAAVGSSRPLRSRGPRRERLRERAGVEARHVQAGAHALEVPASRDVRHGAAAVLEHDEHAGDAGLARARASVAVVVHEDPADDRRLLAERPRHDAHRRRRLGRDDGKATGGERFAVGAG
jgi:hypothetical protein